MKFIYVYGSVDIVLLTCSSAIRDLSIPDSGGRVLIVGRESQKAKWKLKHWDVENSLEKKVQWLHNLSMHCGILFFSLRRSEYDVPVRNHHLGIFVSNMIVMERGSYGGDGGCH